MHFKQFIDMLAMMRGPQYDIEMCTSMEAAYQFASECDHIATIPQEVFVDLLTTSGENVSLSKQYYMVVYRVSNGNEEEK